MKDPDGKLTTEDVVSDEPELETAQAGVEPAPAEQDSVGSEPETNETDDRDGAGPFAIDVAGFSLKVIAIALSFVMLLLSVFTVTMPLQAMRAFNSLGMYERALESGDRYVMSRLKRAGATETDARGNFVVAATTAGLADADMIEAIDTSVDIADRLIKEMRENGDDRSMAYFGEKLERLTRLYLALPGVATVNSERDAIARTLPVYSLRPVVYSRAHTYIVLNYRGRIATGEIEGILYDTGRSEDVVSTVSYRVDALLRGHYERITPELIDRFVDLVDPLSEYLRIELEKLGIKESLNDRIMSEHPEYCRNFLKGDEFSLFIKPHSSDFTDLYKYLRYDGSSTHESLQSYAKAAYDYWNTASNVYNETGDTKEMLRCLYWLQNIYTFGRRVVDMVTLLNFNADAFGGAYMGNPIFSEYPDVRVNFIHLDDDGRPVLINEKFSDLFTKYIERETAAK